MELKPEIANHTGELRRLLIVPYGIETLNCCVGLLGLMIF